MMMMNIDSRGKPSSDAIIKGMLQVPNTSEGNSGFSPAQILFRQTLRGSLPVCPLIATQTILMLIILLAGCGKICGLQTSMH